jgi:hypothetical protein
MRAHLATFGTSDLRDDLADARRELALYRTMVRAALDQLHAQHVALERTREQLADARLELRRYTSAQVTA